MLLRSHLRDQIKDRREVWLDRRLGNSCQSTVSMWTLRGFSWRDAPPEGASVNRPARASDGLGAVAPAKPPPRPGNSAATGCYDRRPGTTARGCASVGRPRLEIAADVSCTALRFRRGLESPEKRLIGTRPSWVSVGRIVSRRLGRFSDAAGAATFGEVGAARTVRSARAARRRLGGLTRG